VGKWAARLAEKTAAPPDGGTDETDERGVLAVLAVQPEGVSEIFQVVPMAPALLDRRARLLRWGWPEAEADALAERLVRRDREHDDRATCTECRHYRPGRCGNHRRAGLYSAEVGRDLGAMLQRCPGNPR
jgi:hypothetical protein